MVSISVMADGVLVPRKQGEKGFLGRKPRTQVRLTAGGRKAFAAYLDALGKLIGPQS